MDASDVDDSTPLISNYGIPTAVRDYRQTHEKQLAVYLILASTLFERIAFYTLAANLALSLDSDKQPYWKSPSPSIATFIFIGASNISTLIFAVISDARLGRSRTILVGFVLYVIGYVLATVFTNPRIHICTFNGSNQSNTESMRTIFEEPCAAWIYPTLIVVAIGAGAVQSNMAVFGAEQIQESKLTSRFFDKYVIVVNIGAIISMFAVPSIQTKERYYYIAYLIAALVLIVAALLFIIGRRYYIHVKPYDTVITVCIPVIVNAFQSWYKHFKKKRSRGTGLIDSSAPNIPSILLHVLRAEESMTDDQRPSTFLDFAKAANHGKYIDRIVDDVKSLRGAFIVFSLLIPYWLIYNQQHSTFREQAQSMGGSQVNQLIIVSLADPLILIIGIVVFVLFVYDYLDAREKSLTIVNKFIIGMCFAVISMCIAGMVENIRQKQWHPGRKESNLTIYAQLPQDICMGISELFIMAGSYEFAYFAAPRSAQTFFMSLRFCSVGVSSFIGTGYIAAFAKPPFHLDFSRRPDPNMRWPFYTYFFILGGLQLIFIIVFIVCEKKFRIIKMNPQQMERNYFLRQSSTISTAR